MFEQRILEDAMLYCKNNKKKAAAHVGLKYSTFIEKLKSLGLSDKYRVRPAVDKDVDWAKEPE